MEQPKIMTIRAIIDEAQDIRTFMFDKFFDAEPGQFVMFWLPRINQKPFGVSYMGNDSFGVTVSKVGPFTEEVFKLKCGDRVGIQGPYGRPFDIKGKNVALIGGGYGTAPLAFLADELKKKNIKTHFIVGARNQKYLCYEERFKNELNMVCCTDDGSCGVKGFTTDALLDLMKKEKIDMVYTCGPEVMMKKVIEICDDKGIDCQVSLERYMKCGFGVCGACVVDPLGVCVCKEGPVFDKDVTKKITEFGSYKRDGSGAKVKI